MKMVGLSVLLEAHNQGPQVINKTTVIKSPVSSPSSSSSLSPVFPSVSFLSVCFLCKQRLLPEKDIYMYNGDRAFCSMECRCRHIVMEEEEEENFSRVSMASQRKRNKNKAF